MIQHIVDMHPTNYVYPIDTKQTHCTLWYQVTHWTLACLDVLWVLPHLPICQKLLLCPLIVVLHGPQSLHGQPCRPAAECSCSQCTQGCHRQQLGGWHNLRKRWERRGRAGSDMQLIPCSPSPRNSASSAAPFPIAILASVSYSPPLSRVPSCRAVAGQYIYKLLQPLRSLPDADRGIFLRPKPPP